MAILFRIVNNLRQTDSISSSATYFFL